MYVFLYITCNSMYSWIDICTVIPIFVTYNYTRPSRFHINTFGDFLLFVLFGLETTRILRVIRIRQKVLELVTDPVERCIGILALTMSVFILFGKNFCHFICPFSLLLFLS